MNGSGKEGGGYIHFSLSSRHILLSSGRDDAFCQASEFEKFGNLEKMLALSIG